MPIKTVTKDIAKTLTVNATVVGVTTFADLELLLKIVLLVMSIGYTLARWRTHCRNNKKK